MKNTTAAFEHLYHSISADNFLRMKSLGGEIPFFIFPFEATDQVVVDKATKGLINKLNNNGVSVLEINLYDLALQIINEALQDNEEIFELEKSMSKQEFKEAIQSLLDINEVLMPRIKGLINASDKKVYFLTGIGLVFPFIRSHNVLNNLQNIAKRAPTVTFFPGKYNGYSLELFGLLKDDNYYRAFNMENYNYSA
ncbi:DUF1788 domain-containing protein [Hymenobacter sp. BT491]|uniref:DUF1788 domain-containing protein n=1 Tax=Hymenobacter sp. BT491 TaxID=2766779 RepID=UPI001653AADF|nr:DUF1788 domain-containing protein [Hymenobacter sp. BT491]MBC6992230.1 DUF1788 domain-containing protein [Hymenobacter sp. BT491]